MERGRGGAGEDRGLREKRWEERERKFSAEGRRIGEEKENYSSIYIAMLELSMVVSRMTLTSST